MLILLTLSNSFFQDFKNWDELTSCHPLKRGSVIRTQNSVLSLPKVAMTGLPEDLNERLGAANLTTRIEHFSTRNMTDKSSIR